MILDITYDPTSFIYEEKVINIRNIKDVIYTTSPLVVEIPVITPPIPSYEVYF